MSGLNALKTLVLREQASINDALLYEPFALDPLTKQSPSVMTIEFINDSVLYRYSLANTAREVVKESLEIYDKTQDDFVYYFKETVRNLPFFQKNIKNTKHKLSLIR